MTRVLIADDEQAILDLLSIYCRNEKYELVLAMNGQQALDFLLDSTQSIDIALLDIMMPEKTGMEVLEEIRAKGIEVPVIFISANEGQVYKISGLLAGADDYVTKPFEPLEVIARIKSVLRRRSVSMNATAPKVYQEHEIELGSIHINKQQQQVFNAAGDVIKLTNLEYSILILLTSELGKVFSSEAILEAVWKGNPSASTKTVMVHVSNLRNKLELATNGDKVVQTVWGLGYKVEPQR